MNLKRFSNLLGGLLSAVAFTLCGGCLLTVEEAAQIQPEPLPQQTAVPVDVGRWIDEREHVLGICFETGWDAAGRIFTIRNAAEHVQFYDLADNSRLCPRPVGRVPRDFSDGYTIIGFWSKGRGCTAAHDVTTFQRHDDSKVLLIAVSFVTDGDCPYDLLRPWWIGVEGVADYEITVIVE